MALIEVKGLTKLYRMGEAVVRALDGVDLNIERGEFVAITGASGSGKSTIMHLIGCLDRPTAGRFVFDGRDFSDLSDRQLAEMRNRQIGFVFQTFNLINRISAVDNVAVPLFYARRSNTRGPALRALERVGLAGRAQHRSNELSGGERQRVAIARAIVNDPPLLLADEPTGNLDSRTGEQIMEIFRDLNRQGVTIVLVTHEHEVAVQARRIVQMRDGKIVSDRLTSELHPRRGLDGLQVRSSMDLAFAEPAAVGGGRAVATPRGGVGPDANVGAVAGGLIRASSARPAVPERAHSDAAPVLSSSSEPAARSEGVDLGPRRLLPGATAAAIVGGVALLFTLAAVALLVMGSLTAKASLPPDVATMSPEQKAEAFKHVPPAMVVEFVVGVISLLGGFATGIVGVIVGWYARRRRREVLGNWYGTRRIWVGVALSCVAVFGPLILGGVRVALAAMSH